MKKYLTFLIIILMFSVSCSSTKTISFKQKPDDIYTTQGLKDFLVQNKTPKVVLRVSPSVLKEVEALKDQENFDYLYNIIENEFLKKGFQVRDRQLFNQIIENDQNTLDYDKIKSKSDTELIIEMSRFDPSVLYETNNYKNKKGQDKVEQAEYFKKYGAKVEFKVVLITKNELAGSYKFHYTPCVGGCVIEKSLKDRNKELKKMKKQGILPYEGVERDDLEIFIRDATSNLVDAMRK